jgi:hypothetical protein
METDTLVPQTPKLTLAGRIVSGLAVFMLAGSAFMKISLNPEMLKNLGAQGITPEMIRNIGILELVCALIYAVPQLSFVGALLLTGYMGGAVYAHVRVGEQFVPPLIPAAVVWVGLALREPRVRALLFRR